MLSLVTRSLLHSIKHLALHAFVVLSIAVGVGVST